MCCWCSLHGGLAPQVRTVPAWVSMHVRMPGHCIAQQHMLSNTGGHHQDPHPDEIQLHLPTVPPCLFQLSDLSFPNVQWQCTFLVTVQNANTQTPVNGVNVTAVLSTLSPFPGWPVTQTALSATLTGVVGIARFVSPPTGTRNCTITVTGLAAPGYTIHPSVLTTPPSLRLNW